MKILTTIENIVEPYLPELEKLGLVLNAIEFHPQIPDYFNIILFNQTSGITIKTMTSKKLTASTTSISNDQSQRWEIRDYFLFINNEQRHAELFFQKSLAEYFRNLVLILKKDLNSIISGEKWVNIPFDFGGAK